ncbi:hypothetical protein SO802_031352 [Lithocarpus litseifolius]|uniref:Uncharacterized protein n=1 Tax=Lithocarpus litseifolius TaxID=425828 RepID=A0AAW2BK43_9ROSI
MEKLCEIVGEIQSSNGATDDDGGSFFQVQVMVDVTSPLCRGRVFTLPSGSKHWMKFSSYKELLNKENGNPIITEIKDEESYFNANSNPSSIDQRMASIKEKTLAASSHGVMLHSLDDQDVNQFPQSTVGILGQQHSLRTWKRVLRQCSLGVLENKFELEKKRKSRFNLVVGTNPPNKHLQVPLESDDTTSVMVEAAVQPYQEP